MNISSSFRWVKIPEIYQELTTPSDSGHEWVSYENIGVSYEKIGVSKANIEVAKEKIGLI